MNADETLKKILWGSRGDFAEALDELDKAFEDGSAFRTLEGDEENDFRTWAQMNYIPGQPISPVWHPVVRDECDLMNLGLLIDPETLLQQEGEYPKRIL